jgi:hypothetical protein
MSCRHNGKTKLSGMLRMRPRSLIIIFIILALCTCIDPYKPALSGYESLLVVEGTITNENVPYEVKLSRTIQTKDAIPEKLSDAIVFITDENGNKTILINAGNGLYRTNNSVFKGAVGKTYSLHIQTKEGKEYVSEPALMLPVPAIDNIYYEKAEEFDNNQSEIRQGIKLYLDSKGGDENNRYLRWEFEETWKFRLPMPKRYNFINDSTIIPINNVREFCWKKMKSADILTNSIPEGQANIIKKEPLCFIAPEKSDRLSIQYSILVRQYSMPKKEAEFWDNLRKVNESGGDIYGSQPFPVISNISNTHDPEEKVLGYFHVSAVEQKRKDITFKEIIPLNLPLYHYNCSRYEASPGDYACFKCSPLTFQDVFNMFDANPYYSFVEPVYDPATRKLQKLVFTTRICSDCELQGTSVKPDFWVDLN